MNNRRICENMEIPVAGGLAIRGLLNLPRRCRGGPSVVFAHGLGSTRGGEKSRALEAECVGRGWTYAAWDFRGHGASDGSMLDLRGSHLIEDLDAVVRCVAERAAGPMFLFGSSMGGWAAAWFLGRHPGRIAACALVAPAFHFLERRDIGAGDREEWRRTGRLRFQHESGAYELGYGLTEEAGKFGVAELAARLHTPLLIFHGMRDEVVPYRESVDFAGACSESYVEVRLFSSGDHRLNTEKQRIARSACNFFESRLQDNPRK